VRVDLQRSALLKKPLENSLYFSSIAPDHQQMTDLLDKAPMRLPHYLAWILASGGTLLDGLSVFLLGMALPLLQHCMVLSALEMGLLGAALVLGAVFGAAIGGRLADRFGRKTIFLLDMLLLALAAGSSALVWDPWSLVVAQLLVGVGIGMDFPVSGSYIAECMPHKQRSRLLVATIAFQAVGLVLGSLLAVALLHLLPDLRAWRSFFAAEMGVGLLFLLGRLGLPESPRWLMGQGRNREAIEMLGRFVPSDRRQLDEMAARLGNTIHYVSKLPPEMLRRPYSSLFHRAYLRSTLLSSVPWFLMDIATYGIGLFTAVLLADMHFENPRLPLIARLSQLAGGTGLIDLFLLFGFLLGLWTVSRFGRIPMQILGFGGMALGMMILWCSTQLPADSHVLVPMIFLGFILFNLFMNMGPNSTTFILPTELYPTQLRATGAGFAAAVAKVGATTGVLILPLVQHTMGVSTVLLLMTFVSVLGLLATWAFGIGGLRMLTLEEHQTSEGGGKVLQH